MLLLLGVGTGGVVSFSLVLSDDTIVDLADVLRTAAAYWLNELGDLDPL